MMVNQRIELSWNSYILDDHYKEGQLDTKSFLRISGTLDERGTNVGSHNFENWRLYIWVSNSFDVSISYFLVPDLQWLAPV